MTLTPFYRHYLQIPVWLVVLAVLPYWLRGVTKIIEFVLGFQQCP